MNKIKVLVACHADSYVPENDIIKSIQVGAAKRPHIDGMSFYDDDGDNISLKNDKYCELTAQYWAWKNLECDYYGFLHYRRYLSFSNNRYKADEYKNVIFDAIDDKFVSDFGLDEKSITDFVQDYDIIAPEPMDFKKDTTLAGKQKNVYTHYKLSKDHDIQDFEFVINYIKENKPEYLESAMEYSASRYGYFLNMYVMKKEVFFDYCEWLFPILEAFDSQKDYSRCNVYANRVVGLLAERLFGIYITFLRKHRTDIKIKETQQSFVLVSDQPYPTPFKSENNVAVCMGSSEYYVPFAGNMIQSIVANSSPEYNYDIFIVTNGVTELSREELKKTVEGINNFSLRFIDGARYLRSRDLYERDHINRTTYLRFSMLDFLRNYDKAIYLDCDMIVNHDISELYNENIDGYYFGAVRDLIQAGWCNEPNSGQYKYNRDKLEMKDPTKYFQAGVLLFNLQELRKDYSASDLYDLALSRDWLWFDQDVLNYISKEGKVRFLKEEWNVTVHSFRNFNEMPEYSAPVEVFETYKRIRKDPYIVHYAGRHIPCFSAKADLPFLFWKYTRQSIFYERILWLMACEASGAQKSKPKKKFIRRVADKLLPHGTRRRAFFKRIYHFFRFR